MNLWQRVLLGLLLLAHGALTWQLVASMNGNAASSELRSAATSGVFFGQGILASLWLVCLRDSRWWRGLCVLLLAGWAWLAITLGSDSSESFSLIGLLFVGMPILVCLLTLSGVLSIAWWIFRWEIRAPGDDGSSPRQFSLRRSLIMMAMVCVFLAVARNALPLEDQSDWTEFTTLTSELPMLLLGVGIYGVMLAVNCCAMLPMIAAMFRCQERWLRWTMVLLFLGVPAYGLVIAIAEGVFLGWLSGGFPISPWMLMATNTIQLLTIVLTLAFLRAIGFRLERVLSVNRKNTPADQPENSNIIGPAAPPSDYTPHGVI